MRRKCCGFDVLPDRVHVCCEHTFPGSPPVFPTLRFQRLIWRYFDLTIDGSTIASRRSYPLVMTESPVRTWSKDVIRLVCMSDTHNNEYTRTAIPAGDVLIHAGDMTKIGTKKELISARAYIDSFSHPQKIVIAGNHEVSLDTSFYCGPKNKYHGQLFKKKKNLDRSDYSSQCRDIISRGNDSSSGLYQYLEDSACFIGAGDLTSSGIKVYGSPYQPEHYLMGFTLPCGPQLKAKWAQIPDDVDVLVTHGPPRGILDKVFDGAHVGCEHLLEAVQSRVKPRVHVFGHIHEGYGTHFDGTTLFVNASVCTTSYYPLNKPIVVDLPLDTSEPAAVVDWF